MARGGVVREVLAGRTLLSSGDARGERIDMVIVEFPGLSHHALGPCGVDPGQEAAALRR